MARKVENLVGKPLDFPAAQIAFGEMRRILGFTNQEVADLSGVSKMSVANASSGAEPVSYKLLDAVLRTLGYQLKVVIVEADE